MTSEWKLESIQKAVPFFAGPLNECADCRLHLLEGAEQRSFPTDTVVSRAGEICDGLYVLVKGFAKEVVLGAKAGTEATVELLKPGDGYGLVSLIDGRESSTSLVTMQPCEFLFIARERFTKGLNEHPEIYRQALDHLCYEVRQAHQWIADLV